MDLSKYPIDKLFHFAAGIIPGFVALLIFQLAHPGVFLWFFSLGYLGYKTSIAIVLLTCFVVGNTITTFIGAFSGMVGGAIGGVMASVVPYRAPHTFEISPWRDSRWRTALKNYLGKDAPKDTLLITEEAYERRKSMLERFANVVDLPTELRNLGIAKFESEGDDFNWYQWYDHFHRIIVSQSDNRDFVFYVRTGFSNNMQAAGLYVLVSALRVPAVRHWWCIVPAAGWVLLGILEAVAVIQKFNDKWLTLNEQIKYLSQAERTNEIASGKAASAGS